jgi:hypothetical protein
LAALPTLKANLAQLKQDTQVKQSSEARHLATDS